MLLIIVLWHALTHKRSILDHECGAKIVMCAPRFWHGYVSCYFIPWPGAHAEKIESSDQLRERIEAHHKLVACPR